MTRFFSETGGQVCSRLQHMEKVLSENAETSALCLDDLKIWNVIAWYYRLYAALTSQGDTARAGAVFIRRIKLHDTVTTGIISL